MDTLDGMKTFVAAVEAGSFTEAADRLSISKKLVSKYVGQLEEQLEVRLMHRTTRRLSLTSEGRRFYESVTRILDEIDDLKSGLRNDAVALSGLLRISAPSTFGEMYVQPLLCAFNRLHPSVTFDLRLTDRYVDLTEAGFDLAIRIGDLENSSLIARKLAQTELWAVASPPYLKRRGTPEKPADLLDHDCIHDTNMRSGNRWVFSQGDQLQTVNVTGNFKVNSARFTRDLALGGEGIALCPDYVVARNVTEGGLVRILCGAKCMRKDIHAVFQNAKYMPVRVRAFIEFLSTELPTISDWQGADR